MDPERHEVYERIPWESLERGAGGRQWILYAVAGAVTLGSLAYSLTRDASSPTLETVAPAPNAAAPAVTSPPVTSGGSPPVSSPMVIAEADLFAVDEESFVETARSYAEWVAVEFYSVDASPESADQLAAMLPSGIPAPEAPLGTQVFVDWVRARSVATVAPLQYEVEVLLRSLLSTDGAAFSRLPTRLARIGVKIAEDGMPRLAALPTTLPIEVDAGDTPELVAVPEDVASLVRDRGDVVGGWVEADGSWAVVVMSTGIDGVRRPAVVRP